MTGAVSNPTPDPPPSLNFVFSVSFPQTNGWTSVSQFLSSLFLSAGSAFSALLWSGKHFDYSGLPLGLQFTSPRHLAPLRRAGSNSSGYGYQPWPPAF